jgi:hypothetical protein
MRTTLRPAPGASALGASSRCGTVRQLTQVRSLRTPHQGPQPGSTSVRSKGLPR